MSDLPTIEKLRGRARNHVPDALVGLSEDVPDNAAVLKGGFYGAGPDGLCDWNEGDKAGAAGSLHVELYVVAWLRELGAVVEHEDGFMAVWIRHDGTLTSCI